MAKLIFDEIEFLLKNPRRLRGLGKLTRLGDVMYPNPILTKRIRKGDRDPEHREYITKRLDYLRKLRKKLRSVPTFLVAEPRRFLWVDPKKVGVAILTAGGVASGLNRVVHSIVRRHCGVYGLDEGQGGIVYGVLDSFRGIDNPGSYRVTRLTEQRTQEWIDRGGSMLGSMRGEGEPQPETWYRILRGLSVDIVYIIGGDGTQKAALSLHKVIQTSRKRNGPEHRDIVVAGIPKTMDNDIVWTDRSFGFQSTVDEAARIIKALRDDAFSTRRLCVIQLFGRHSGFVAASASLASGCVDAVLIPEEVPKDHRARRAFGGKMCKYLCAKIKERREQRDDRAGYAVVVAAEGAGPHEKNREGNLEWLTNTIRRGVVEKIWKDDSRKDKRERILVVEPRYLIRAIPPNPNDHIYCERLADLAVDSALAGYTGFMISRWDSQFVLIDLEHVAGDPRYDDGLTKVIDTKSLFWKQVTNSTGQPAFR